MNHFNKILNKEFIFKIVFLHKGLSLLLETTQKQLSCHPGLVPVGVINNEDMKASSTRIYEDMKSGFAALRIKKYNFILNKREARLHKRKQLHIFISEATSSLQMFLS